jgi:hypothetical protein
MYDITIDDFPPDRLAAIVHWRNDPADAQVRMFLGSVILRRSAHETLSGDAIQGEHIADILLVRRHVRYPMGGGWRSFPARDSGSCGVEVLVHQMYDELGYSATTTFRRLNSWSTCVCGSTRAVTPR